MSEFDSAFVPEGFQIVDLEEWEADAQAFVTGMIDNTMATVTELTALDLYARRDNSADGLRYMAMARELTRKFVPELEIRKVEPKVEATEVKVKRAQMTVEQRTQFVATGIVRYTRGDFTVSVRRVDATVEGQIVNNARKACSPVFTARNVGTLYRTMRQSVTLHDAKRAIDVATDLAMGNDLAPSNEEEFTTARNAGSILEGLDRPTSHGDYLPEPEA